MATIAFRFRSIVLGKPTLHSFAPELDLGFDHDPESAAFADKSFSIRAE